MHMVNRGAVVENISEIAKNHLDKILPLWERNLKRNEVYMAKRHPFKKAKLGEGRPDVVARLCMVVD